MLARHPLGHLAGQSEIIAVFGAAVISGALPRTLRGNASPVQTSETMSTLPDPTPASDELAARDIADVPAVEVITTVTVHLMSAAAVKCGLAEGGEDQKDLDEARKLITALAGLVTAGAPEISNYHAAPLRDGLRSLQLAFREASLVKDEPGAGPGEKFTGPVRAR